MPRINLEQGSPEWLRYRQAHIMATDASIIAGVNPWSTPLKLFEEKLGMRPPQLLNDKMLEGQKLEPIARDIACKELGINFEPCVYESEKYCWMAASLDGLCPESAYILEIKCGKKSHEMALLGKIPEYYELQMHHQLMVTGSEMAYYVSYRPENKLQPIVIIEFQSNEKIAEQLIQEQQKFWINLCTMQPPETPFIFQHNKDKCLSDI